VIFGIGLSKTGTTSLFAALDRLGYRAGTYRHLRALGLQGWFSGDFRRDYLGDYDAVTDLPLAVYYAQLDKRYPGSKFILTVRDMDSWLESARQHFTRVPGSDFGRDVRLVTYGVTGFDRERFRWVHEAHTRNVNWYFRDRPETLLTLDIIGGEGWTQLCSFLGDPAPSGPFPHVQPGYRLARELSGGPTLDES
jgi:hypothetical protein